MHTIKRTNLASKIINPHLKPPEKRINGGECYLTECRFHAQVEPLCGGFPENSKECYITELTSGLNTLNPEPSLPL